MPVINAYGDGLVQPLKSIGRSSALWNSVRGHRLRRTAAACVAATAHRRCVDRAGEGRGAVLDDGHAHTLVAQMVAGAVLEWNESRALVDIALLEGADDVRAGRVATRL